jgi:adenosylcobyric acid synthase
VRGALLVAGTGSDAGKSTVVAGLCRWLARQGVRVAPFKAQNMALNSGVTPDGAEIGRAQVLQAAAAGIPPEVAMNPVLLKPSRDRASHVVVLGRPAGLADAAAYQERKAALRTTVLAALADLRARFDVVVCEGAGSPAEVNLRAGDLVNMGLARAAHLPTVVVGDIDRGGVLAAFAGTLALLEPADQALVAGFVVNRFRGDPALLAPGLDAVRAATGRPTLGVLPYLDGLTLEAEDSLVPFAAPSAARPAGRDGLTVAVVAHRRLSNVTDVDALAAEPGVAVRLTTSPVEVERADLAVVPGTRATVDDLAALRALGIDEALARRAAAGAPVLGICGGYQLLGAEIDDPVESGAGRVPGLGLLPVTTRFAAGYEIHHGRTSRHGGAPLLVREDGGEDGCAEGAVLGTTWHGLLEGDAWRAALLRWVAQRRGRAFTPAGVTFAAVREASLDRLGDLVADHLDTAAITRLVEHGPPALPTVALERIPA